MRETSRVYTFKSEDGEVIQVCQLFFLGTLGYKRSHVVDWLFKKHAGKAVADCRGSHEPLYKMSTGTVNAVIAHRFLLP